MYDRRVVRGNTFAALVIPVSKLNPQLIIPSSFRYAARSSINREAEARIDVSTTET